MDERLTLAASLYEPCALGADIGTDHGLLPCHLLEAGVCQRMILADISPKALRHAEEQVRRRGLTSRAELVCADGFAALTEPAGCVSITGMGGKTMADMLCAGASRLAGAALVLSAHTDQEQVRRAVQAIGYHFTAERLCRAAGRFYLVWKALPGPCAYTEDELALGTPLLLNGGDSLLPDYLAWRQWVLERKLAGLIQAAQPDEATAAHLREQLEQLRRHTHADCAKRI